MSRKSINNFMTSLKTENTGNIAVFIDETVCHIVRIASFIMLLWYSVAKSSYIC